MDSFFVERSAELWLRLGEHIVLTGSATLLAIVIGLPLGILASRNAVLGRIVTGAASILQTIPSLAMLAFLLALFNRIGFTPAIIALTLYALLPIIRNTLTGFQNVPVEATEAAQGMGMSPWQQLRMVEFPLALPSIVAGIRTAAVIGVGIATLSAFVGAGGLGQFINRGLSLSNHQLILLGAIPSALLALLIDASIGATHWALQPKIKRAYSGHRRWIRLAALWSPSLILLLGLAASPGGSRTSGSDDASTGTVHIGAKNFSEQLIIGELMAQLIERHTSLAVERTFDLGGTIICHEALVSGEIDLYAEYAGTALTTIMKHTAQPEPSTVFDTVAAYYKTEFKLLWLPPLGFNNTYAITVRDAAAEAQGWKTISDLKPDASSLKAGWTFEFSERPDGYPGLRRHYDLEFGTVADLEMSLMYQAAAQGDVDVICAFSTDGRIADQQLRVLEDDRHFFPPYEAAAVVREAFSQQHPEVITLLNRLAGRLDDETMRQLNAQVDLNKDSPRQVAQRFLDAQRL